MEDLTFEDINIGMHFKSLNPIERAMGLSSPRIRVSASRKSSLMVPMRMSNAIGLHYIAHKKDLTGWCCLLRRQSIESDTGI